MNCQQVRHILDDYFDRILSAQDEGLVEEHLFTCPDCRAVYEEMETLGGLIRASSQPEFLPDDKFFARALERVFSKDTIHGSRRFHGKILSNLRSVARAMERRRQEVMKRFLSRRPHVWRFARAVAIFVAGFMIATALYRQDVRTVFGERWRTASLTHPKSTAPAPVSALTSFPVPSVASLKSTDIHPPGEPVIDKSQRSALEAALNEAEKAGTSPSPANLATRPVWGLTMEGKAGIPSLEGLSPAIQGQRLLLVASPARQDEVIESIQRLKLNLYISGESRFIPDLHKLERFVADIADATQESDSAYFSNLMIFQEAEQCLVDKKYLCAIQNYSAVSDEAPGSLMSFLAEFQTANVNYEQIGDYKASLKHYQKCLENYPSHYISEEKKEIILKRIDLLTRNAADDWRPLRLFLKAKGRDVNPDQAVSLLKQLITEYPNCSLVRDATDALASRIINDDDASLSAAEELIAFFQQIHEKFGDKYMQQMFQFKTAEIYHQKLRNYPQALLEYTHVMEMDSQSDLAEKARARVNSLYRYGIKFR
ncbi:MAG: zf-HC2 domain-containing protein [Candidatus Sumerlaeota bacterium]|nr:zf-HC2 domain-containing protein [Candidatus Sumerlaeota bacterium]